MHDERSAQLVEQLRELDAELGAVPLPAGLETRILAAASQQRRPVVSARAGVVVGVAVAFAAGVLLTLAWVGRAALESSEPMPGVTHTDSPAPQVHEPSPVPAGSLAVSPSPGLTITAPDCVWSQLDGALRFAAGCRLQLAAPRMDIETWAPSRLRTIDDGVAVEHGLVSFAVAHREDPTQPARVGVSGGTIEILGTRFVVAQADIGGHVDLLDGAIAFRDLGGVVEAVEPGQRHHWRTPMAASDEPPAVPTPGTDTPAHGVDATAEASAEALAEALAEVARLRRAGRDAEAIAKLDALAQIEHDPRTREVISYERGTLVERSAAVERACASWATHRRQFPSGRYDADITRRVERLGCALSPGRSDAAGASDGGGKDTRGPRSEIPEQERRRK